MTGEIIEIPDRKLITHEIIDYWEKRINETNNHILKARYSGLVWDFKLFVTGNKCDINIARIYIQSLIYIINRTDVFLKTGFSCISYSPGILLLMKNV